VRKTVKTVKTVNPKTRTAGSRYARTGQCRPRFAREGASPPQTPRATVYTVRMAKSTPSFIQSSIDFIDSFYTDYERGELDLKTLSILDLVRLQNAFELSYEHLNYVEKPQLTAFRRLIAAHLSNF
jgi:hypothetical protein